MSHHRDWPLVKRGDEHENVRTVQYLLNHREYDLEVDGVFGSKTEDDVRDFQEQKRLTIDGEVGNETWPALIVQVSQGSEGDAVKAVQSQLNVTVDGIFGPGTDRRVREIQEMFGFQVDGVVGPETWWLIVSPKSE